MKSMFSTGSHKERGLLLSDYRRLTVFVKIKRKTAGIRIAQVKVIPKLKLFCQTYMSPANK